MKTEKRKMTMGRGLYFFALFIVSCYLLFVTGCRDPFNADDMAIIPPAGKGSFSLTLSGASRNILPSTPSESDFAVYNLAFTPTNGGAAANEDRTNETLVEPILLEPGTYSLEVSAYKDSDKTQLVARGTLNDIEINAGQNTAKTVILEALLSGGAGTFSWDIILPPGVSAQMIITPVSAGGTPEQIVTLDPSDTAGSETLASGQYRLTFVLNKADGKTVEWIEMLHVYQNLESVFEFEFKDAHLSDSGYFVTYKYNDGVTDDEVIPVLHSDKLEANNPTRDGYTFGGWYTNAAFTGAAYDFNQPVIGSFILYAKWEVGASKENAVILTENEWADGNLPTTSSTDGYQWFVFEATAATQYIHAAFGTLTNLYVQVYDSSGETAVGSDTNLFSSATNTNTSLTLTVGDKYYIRVRPNGSGTYRIAFNATPYPPGITPIPLAANQWADGILPTSNDVQWFSFTATASTQYIHIEFGTLRYIYVQLYDSSGEAAGSETYLTGSNTANTSISLTSGDMYYIKVWPRYGDYSGIYWIGFNTSTTAPLVKPPSNAIQLTENIWEDGNLSTPNYLQWFTFTATASTQYIHASFGTLTNLYVQVYTSAGAELGNKYELNSSTTNTSRSLTSGDTYYIKVWPRNSGYSGTYRIGFNKTVMPPFTNAPISLTENQWANGDLPTSSDIQWFVFTATSTTQYIHTAFDTLSSSGSINVQVYDSSGATSGSGTSLSGTTRSTSRSLTLGETYYIMVRLGNSAYSGTYRIGFTASFVPPEAIPLTVNQFADGNLTRSSDEQWFSFTATASTQYIHATFGTLSGIYVQVYESSGAKSGIESGLNNFTDNILRSLTSGQIYYIMVRQYINNYSGTYQIGFNTSTTKPLVQLPSNAIPLTANLWTDGNIPTSSDVQWFSFTAIASTQIIHFELDTLPERGIQVYNSSGTEVESKMFDLSSSTTNILPSLTIGQTYYIKVRPGNGSSGSGTYRILFNTTPYPPGITPIPLAANQWTDSNIQTSELQWFSFTATASTQYIHVSFGTLTDLFVNVCNSSTRVGSSRLNSASANKYISLTSLTVGQTYYIRVEPFTGLSGTYRIGFNTSTTAPVLPVLNPIPLTVNVWADGNIPTGSDEQWFTFTATAATQYIHVSFGTLTILSVQVYTSSGAISGSETALYGTTTNTSRSLTSGQTYYIRVRPYSSSYSGTYRIGFTTSIAPPGAIPLTVDQWTDGSLPTPGSEQWFTFTATASTQYIHISFGTLDALYVQVYTSNGVVVGSETQFYSSTSRYTTRSLTLGQTYYIKVRPYIIINGDTYKIGFNDSPQVPAL